MSYPNVFPESNLMGDVVISGGKIYRRALAHAALTAGVAYLLVTTEDGPTTAALTAGAVGGRLCIPEVGIASGAYGWVQTGGEVDLTGANGVFTAGDAVEVDAGVIESIGAAYADGDTAHLCVIKTTTTINGTTVLTVPVYLTDKIGVTST
jgi:hypothetical protein